MTKTSSSQTSTRGSFLLALLCVVVIFQVPRWNKTLGAYAPRQRSLAVLTDNGNDSNSRSSSSNLIIVNSVNVTQTMAVRLEQQNKPQIHMVVVADPAFARRYTPIFDRMQQYATKHGYTWTVLGKDYFAQRQTPTECLPYRNFFFLKHCMVASWMEAENLAPTDAVFVFDSDNVPHRMGQDLSQWAQFNETIVLYVRGWSNEIMAGNYMVHNTIAGRDFLRAWAHYEFVMPKGFSSYDNGALHLHLLRFLNMEQWNPVGPCGTLYNNLKSPVTNLTDYWKFVTCTRQSLTTNRFNQTHTKGNFSMRLMPQRSGFAVDHHLDSNEPDTRGAVFHHGVKIDGDMSIKQRSVERYNLTLPVGFKIQKETPPAGVSCGMHRAATCGACGPAMNWCNGECHWCPTGAATQTIPPTQLTASLQCVPKAVVCRPLRSTTIASH